MWDASHIYVYISSPIFDSRKSSSLQQQTIPYKAKQHKVTHARRLSPVPIFNMAFVMDEDTDEMTKRSEEKNVSEDLVKREKTFLVNRDHQLHNF